MVGIASCSTLSVPKVRCLNALRWFPLQSRYSNNPTCCTLALACLSQCCETGVLLRSYLAILLPKKGHAAVADGAVQGRPTRHLRHPHTTLAHVQQAGCPICCCYQHIVLLAAQAQAANVVLGDRCLQEPTMSCWHTLYAGQSEKQYFAINLGKHRLTFTCQQYFLRC